MASEDDFLSSVEGINSKRGWGTSSGSVAGVGRLVRVYQTAYERRYGVQPVVDSAGRFILSTFRQACVDDGRGERFAEEVIATFLTVDDEWFTKSRHSLFSFKNNLNVVVAEIGARRKAQSGIYAAKQASGAVDHIELILYYLFESDMWLKGRNLTKASKEEILTAGGHKVSKTELREYFRINWTWGGTDEIGELCDLLDKYLSALDSVPAAPTA